MDKYIEIFDAKGRTMQDILDDGYASETLRNNTIFSDTVKKVYWKLTLAEDVAVSNLHGKDHREANEQIKRISVMRALLVDIVSELDGNILEAENAKLNTEV